MNDCKSRSIKLHKELRGKIEVTSRVSIDSMDDLSVAYSPGVAEPCLEIQKDVDKSYLYTRRHNLIAVVTDGSAVLGLGDIGPEAAMPVIEGKALLFKQLGGVDAVPLCLRTQDTEEIVRSISLLAGSFGGINLEDIAAPRCFEIERRLKQICDIPIFHDDQHGTAIVVGAALVNALKLVNKSIDTIRVVINGAGAAGIAIANYLLDFGVNDMIVCDRFGILSRDDESLSPAHLRLARNTNQGLLKGSLDAALKNADVFIGVSAPNVVSKSMIESMSDKPIVFPLANPDPEIIPDLALEAGAYVVGTGSSQYANQINNVLAFPGVFRGALDARASDITLEMMMAASEAIANYIPEDKLAPEYIIPEPLDRRVHDVVAAAVEKAARASGVARIEPHPEGN